MIRASVVFVEKRAVGDDGQIQLDGVENRGSNRAINQLF